MNTMPDSFEVTVLCHNGWYSAINSELDLGGSGKTEKEAMDNFFVAFQSLFVTRAALAAKRAMEKNPVGGASTVTNGVVRKFNVSNPVRRLQAA